MSSNTYVPPALRNQNKMNDQQPNQRRRFDNNNRRPYRPREEPKEEKPEPYQYTETDFPALGAGTGKVRVFGGEKSFAALANEWKDHTEQEENSKKAKEFQEKQESNYYRQNVPLPVFHNVRRFVEPEDEPQMKQPKRSKEDDEGWILVDRKKIYHEKTLQEKIEQREKEEQANEDSVWGENDRQEHETCWDEAP